MERPESALGPVVAILLSMLLAGGLGLTIGGLVPVPAIRLPSWESPWAAEPLGSVDPNGGEWLDRSEPTRVDADAIDIHAPLTNLGVTFRGEFEVPSLHRPHLAGWFEEGAAPGQFGATVLFGHVDSDVSGPAVFYRLRDLEEGDRIELSREDGIVVVYKVTGIDSYPKDELPYEEVFGIERRPALRLITCGGRFDRGDGDYTENLVAYASYESHRRETKEDRDRPLNERKDFDRKN